MAAEIHKPKLILDVDTGVDDALAILYAVLSERVDVIGITTCFGNVDVETATHNTLSLLELSGHNIPVYQGAARPLLRQWSGPVPWIHGDNGLGNAEIPSPTGRAEQMSAAEFIREAIRAYPGEVIVVPVARMTNLAYAFSFDPQLASQVKRIVTMGGAAFCPGNVTPVAEANIWGDPEAAQVVFTSGAPITMVGLDVTMKVALTESQLDRIDPTRPYARVIRDAVSFYMKAYEETQGAKEGWCPLHDPLAVAVAEDPTLCRVQDFHVEVETQGVLTAGMTVVDARSRPEHAANTSVCVEVDGPRFLGEFCNRIGIN